MKICMRCTHPEICTGKQPKKSAEAKLHSGGASAVIADLLGGARTTEHNAYKVTLAQRTLAGLIKEYEEA